MHPPLREYSENYWETRGGRIENKCIKREEKRESLSPVFLDRKASMMLVTIEFQSGIKGFPSPISTQFLPSETANKWYSSLHGTMLVPLEIKYWKVINFTRSFKWDRFLRSNVNTVNLNPLYRPSLLRVLSPYARGASIGYYSMREIPFRIDFIRTIMAYCRGNNFLSIILYELISNCKANFV